MKPYAKTHVKPKEPRSRISIELFFFFVREKNCQFMLGLYSIQMRFFHVGLAHENINWQTRLL